METARSPHTINHSKNCEINRHRLIIFLVTEYMPIHSRFLCKNKLSTNVYAFKMRPLSSACKTGRYPMF